MTFSELRQKAAEEIVAAGAHRPTPSERRRKTAEWGIDAQLDLIKIVHQNRPGMVDSIVPNHVRIFKEMGISPAISESLVEAYIKELRR